MLDCMTALPLLVLVKLKSLALTVNVKMFFRGYEDFGSVLETGDWVGSACYGDCQVDFGRNTVYWIYGFTELQGNVNAQNCIQVYKKFYEIFAFPI